MIYAVLIGFGVCLGSFVNALVWRLHEQSKPKKKRAAKDVELSITKGRSMCVNCGHTLTAKDLIPVVSWLSLGGKCRYCKKPISWQYPIVELVTAALFVVSYIYWPQNMHDAIINVIGFIVWLFSIVIGMALVVYDFKWMLLPNKLVRILGLLGAIFALVSIVTATNLSSAFVQLLLSVVVAGGLFYLLYQVSDGKWIGGGDVKLGLVLGLFLSTPLNAGLMLFASSLLGCFYALLLVIVGKYKKGAHVPFGPFLLLATLIIVLFGASLISHYKSLILI